MVKNKDFCVPEKIICHVLQKLFQAICTGGNNYQIIIFFGKCERTGSEMLCWGKRNERG